MRIFVENPSRTVATDDLALNHVKHDFFSFLNEQGEIEVNINIPYFQL